MCLGGSLGLHSKAEKMLPGLGAVWGTNAIDALRNERLLTDSVEVRYGEVQNQTGRKTERNHRQEERHDLHDHLLLVIGLSSWITALNLSLLNEAADGNNHNQHEERQGVSDALLHCLTRAL